MFYVWPSSKSFSEMFFNSIVSLESDIWRRKVYLSDFYYKCIKELNELFWALSLVLKNCTKMKFIFFLNLNVKIISFGGTPY